MGAQGNQAPAKLASRLPKGKWSEAERTETEATIDSILKYFPIPRGQESHNRTRSCRFRKIHDLV